MWNKKLCSKNVRLDFGGVLGFFYQEIVLSGERYTKAYLAFVIVYVQSCSIMVSQ